MANYIVLDVELQLIVMIFFRIHHYTGLKQKFDRCWEQGKI